MNKLWMAAGSILAGYALPAVAAEPLPSWYVALSGGVTYMDSRDIGGVETGKLKYSNNGGMAAVALGYGPGVDFQPLADMRFELELGYHHNSLDSSLVGAGPTVSAGGDIHSYTYMANAYYDFSNTTQVTPYVGAGLGGAVVHVGRSSGLGNTDSSTNVFAYQFMAGITYAPPMLPLTEWSLGYRYLDEANPAFDSAAGKIKLSDAVMQDVELGGRLHF